MVAWRWPSEPCASSLLLLLRTMSALSSADSELLLAKILLRHDWLLAKGRHSSQCMRSSTSTAGIARAEAWSGAFSRARYITTPVERSAVGL